MTAAERNLLMLAVDYITSAAPAQSLDGKMKSEGEKKSKTSSAEEMSAALRSIELTPEQKRVALLAAVGAMVIIALAFMVANYIFPPKAVQSGNYLAQCNGYTGAQVLLYDCLQNLAVAQENASICDEIGQPSAQYGCIVGVAQKYHQISACSYLTPGSTYFSECVSALLNSQSNMSSCNNLVQPYQLSCIFNVSMSQNFGNLLQCNLLANGSSGAAACRDLYYFKQAASRMNQSYCAPLPQTKNGTLLGFVAQNSTTNIQSALYVSLYYSRLNTTLKNYCYYTVAVASFNSTICRQITDNSKPLCTAAVVTANISRTTFNLTAPNMSAACNTYINASFRSACSDAYALHQAEVRKNTALCGYFANSTLAYDYCKLTLAINTTNSSICPLISNGTFRSVCTISVAALQKQGGG